MQVAQTRYENSPIGRLVPVEVIDGERRLSAQAYLPEPLPEEIAFSSTIASKLEEAVLALGRLDGVARRLPNPWLLARPAIRREAISSSSLEGTVSTMSALLAAELLEDPTDMATFEVRNFVRAMEQGVQGLAELPVSLRLIKELHGILLSGVRGDSFRLGELRTSQNWIGPPGTSIQEAQFVPPPAGDLLRDGLSQWEKWVHGNHDTPLLVKVALAHYQFETLHPFDDGNGRIGRLVALLMLIEADALSVPLLDISTWLEARRDAYIGHLREVSETGDFHPWILFFLQCISEQSIRSLEKATALLELGIVTVDRLRQEGVRGMALQIAESLIGYPFLTVSAAAEMTGRTYQGASKSIARLIELDVLRPVPGEWYPQVYYAPNVFDIIN